MWMSRGGGKELLVAAKTAPERKRVVRKVVKRIVADLLRGLELVECM
jgi:hypothetical protein